MNEDDNDFEDAAKQIVATSDYTLRELAATQTAVRELARHVGLKTELPIPHMSTDQLWCCGSCGTRLGVYAPEPEDILRIKHKDLLLHLRLGKGGYIELFCRSCGALNRQDYTAAA